LLPQLRLVPARRACTSKSGLRAMKVLGLLPRSALDRWNLCLVYGDMQHEHCPAKIANDRIIVPHGFDNQPIVAP